jgi:beta-glucosidase
MSRIDTLVATMTLPEKLGQLTMTAAGLAVTGPVLEHDSTDAVRSGEVGNLLNLYGSDEVHAVQRIAVEETRLGVPLLIGFDVVHGHRTLFPVPLAEAGLFDPATWAATAREAAKEAAADGLAMTFAPMLDISRDPRWGRGIEGPGEDPWLAARFAEAKVEGFQAPDLAAAESLAAVAKHYCAYGAVMAGRDYASVDISERTLREVYLPPFEAAVAKDVAAVMPAFTDFAGIPMTANKALLQGWLRGRLGFSGVIVSDYNAIGELVRHGVAADLAEAAALALEAGIDIDMMAGAYRHGIPIALARGLVAQAQIDAAVRRVLALKERLGLFEDPYRRGRMREAPAALAERRRLARDVAARSLVLLKNEGDALPLAGTIRKLAVLGPLAEAGADMRGPWAAAAPPGGQIDVVTGLRYALPAVEVVHHAGVSITGDDVGGLIPATALCQGADAVVLCLGEAATMSGEAASRAEPVLPGHQEAFALDVIRHARASGAKVVVLLFSGRPLIVNRIAEQADAVIAAWFPGTEAGNAVADILTGRLSPSGRTAISWPRSIGQIPVFFSARPTGRPAERDQHYTSRYLDVPNEPLFPFGFGLTYGRFVLSGLTVSPDRVEARGSLRVSVDVANEGRRSAEETVFLFVRDKVASVARPQLELKGVAKVALRPGEKRTVVLSLKASDLSFLGPDLEPVIEPGEVEILVGPCADRSRLLSRTIVLVPART